MWVFEAQFDDEQAPYRKFLKPGGEYHFGRKAPADFILADKTVSKESANVYVGPCKPSEEHRPPKLTIHALKKMIRIIDPANEEEWERDRERFIGETVPADSKRELRSGDIIILTRSAPPVRVLWLPVALCVSNKIPKEAVEQHKQDCQILGIGLERSKLLLPNTTHFVLPTSAALTAQLMQAIMAAAHLVTSDYIDDLLRKAKLGRDDDNSLEKRLVMPDVKAYFPDDIEIEGLPRPEVAKALAANERRKTMFVGTTFLFIHGEEGLPRLLDTSIILCKAGRGRVVVENAAKLQDDEMMMRLLRRNLSEAQSLLAECGEAASEAPDEGLVVICCSDDIGTDWHTKLVQMTRQMKIAMPTLSQVAISKAVLHADARQFLNKMADDVDMMETQMLPSTNYETLPPTAPPPQIKANLPAMDLDEEIQSQASVIRRGPSPTPTTVPSTSAAATDTQRSPRKPKRRAEMARRNPLDDIFGSSAPSSIAATSSKTTGDETPLPTQSVRSTARPRRYDGTDNKRPRASDTWRSIFATDTNGTQEMEHEGLASTYNDDSQSKTRKYRLELDEEDRLATQRASASQATERVSRATSQVGDETAVPTRKRAAPSPAIEESQPARQRQRHSEEMVQDGDDSASTTPAPPDTLARKVIRADEQTSNTDKTGNTNTDAKFLQAMATSKRSKKGLDQFDKDFNSLRLARPTHATGHHGKIIDDADDPEYRAWQQMGASDFDINAAGNFVQVDFVPLVYHRSEEEQQERDRRQAEMMEKWNGKPNFKKFRAKDKPRRQPLVLDVDEGNDYGLGDGYVRASKASARAATQSMASFSDDDDDDMREMELMGPPPKPGPTRRKQSYQADPFSDDDDDDETVQSVAASRRSTQSTATQRKKQRSETTSPEEERTGTSQRRRAVDVRLDVDVDLDDSIYRSRPRATPSNTNSATNTKRAALELSSDEDDEGGGFSGFRKKRRN